MPSAVLISSVMRARTNRGPRQPCMKPGIGVGRNKAGVAGKVEQLLDGSS